VAPNLIDILINYGGNLLCLVGASPCSAEIVETAEEATTRLTPCQVVVKNKFTASKVGIEFSDNHFLVYRKFIDDSESTTYSRCCGSYASPNTAFNFDGISIYTPNAASSPCHDKPYTWLDITSYMDGISCENGLCRYFMMYDNTFVINGELANSFSLTLINNIDLHDFLPHPEEEITIIPIPNAPVSSKNPSVVSI
jgi:hypothetical protein